MNKSAALLDDLLAENTTTGDVAPVLVGAPLISGPLAARRRRRRLVREDEDPENEEPTAGAPEEDGVIPKNAEPLATETQPLGQSVPQPTAPSAQAEPLIPTAVALVAPDCTSSPESPLDPTQVPTAQTPAATPPQATAPAPEPAAQAGAQGSVLRGLMGLHQSQYRPASTGEVKTESAAKPAAPVATDAEAAKRLAESIKADAKAKAFTAGIMAQAEGSMPAPHHNPHAAAKAAAAMRMVMGG